MQKLKFLCSTLTLAALASIPAVSNATITVYTSQASFQAAVSSFAVDSFDNLPVNQQVATPLSRTVGAFSYSIDATNGALFNTSSGSDVWLAPDLGNDAVTFSGFSSNVWAVGAQLFLTNIDGLALSAGTLAVQATDASGTVTKTLTNPGISTFLGFVSNGPITSLSLASGQTVTPFQWPTVNNLTLAAVVPEPGSQLLLLGGLVMLGLWVSRRPSA